MPYSYYKGTELAGYDIELAHRFAAWLGAGLEFKVYDFGGIIAAAQAGNIDCIMSNLFYTPEKDESIPFSDPLFEVDITAMVRDTTQSAQSATTAAYTSVDQLNGKVIGSATGTTYDEIVKRRLPDVTFSYFNTYSDMVAALTAGKISAFACDEPVLQGIIAENSQVMMLPEYLDTFEYGFIFGKTPQDQALCGQLSGFIREIKADGTPDELRAKDPGGRLDAVFRDLTMEKEAK
jgi:polar amino acid transport system substrate-binding protein